MKQNNEYKVGMYVRLSKEDHDQNMESESITNQKNLILNYIQENNYYLVEEYIDDGFSGTSFDRPAFNRLLQDIEMGKINIVITKDLSRLGRDYIQSGYYVEKYFPENHIRYISILDNLDTTIDNADNDITPFKLLMNDMYAKDISKKVKSVLKNKKRQGLFVGWMAPYGYMKDPSDKHKLIIQEEEAKVVAKIFILAKEGYSCKKIADTLSMENIPIPSVSRHLNRGQKSKAYGLWCPKTISEMLTNTTYAGHLTQYRRKKLNYKSKKEVRTDPADWIIVKNTHKPIIDEQSFNIVQTLISKNKYQREIGHYLLSGFLFCKECNHALGISPSYDKKRSYLGCTYYRKYSKFHVCTPHTMNYQKLERAVLNELQDLCTKYVDKSNLEKILSNYNKTEIKTISYQNELIKIENNIELLKRKTTNLYMDRLNNIISVEMYQKIDSQILTEMQNEEEKKKELHKQLESVKPIFNDYNSIISEYLLCIKLDRTILASIIDRITINKNKEINIYYKIK